MSFLLFLLGAAMLFVGGDWLVRGASAVGERLGLKPAIAAATIVALGASAPEVATTLTATLRGAPALAAATIAGANVANLLLVVGVSALFAPVVVATPGARRGALVVWLACLAWAGLAFTGQATLWAGIAALLGALVYIVILAREAAADSADPELADATRIYEIESTPSNPLMVAALVFAGPVFLIMGAHFAVSGARALAGAGDDTTAGAVWLGIAAVLPELGTALAAALRKRTGLILPAVFGGVVFNALAVGGIAAFAHPLPLDAPAVQADVLAMAGAATLAGAVVLLGRPIPRAGGLFALLLYVGFLRFVAS